MKVPELNSGIRKLFNGFIESDEPIALHELSEKEASKVNVTAQLHTAQYRLLYCEDVWGTQIFEI